MSGLAASTPITPRPAGWRLGSWSARLGDPVVRARLGVGAVAIAFAAFGATVAPREDVVGWLVLNACALPMLWLCARTFISELGPAKLRRAVIVAALALRVGALVAPVSLSDDVHRYMWDGALLVHGHDPYAARPREVAELDAVSLHRIERLNSPDYYSVYPPVAQVGFAIAAGASELSGADGTTLLRAMVIGLDLLAIWLLFGLLERLNRSRAWALAYALHPMVIWEVAAGPHTESLMLPFMLGALVALFDRRALLAGVLFGLAVGAKLTAAIVFAMLVLHPLYHRRWRDAALLVLGSVGALSLVVLPFYSAHLWPHIRESLALYRDEFSFNALIYYPARDGLGYVEGFVESKDRWLMPWLTAGALIWTALATLAVDGDRRRLVGLCAVALAGSLILGRVMHPWYLLPVLALGVAAASRAFVVLALLVPLSYLRYDPIGHEARWVIGAQIIGLSLGILLDMFAGSREGEPFDSVAS